MRDSGSIFAIDLHILEKRVFHCAMWTDGFWLRIFGLGWIVKRCTLESDTNGLSKGLYLFGWVSRLQRLS